MKKLGNRIKNIFKKDSKWQSNENTNTLQINNISNNSENTQSDNDNVQPENEIVPSDNITPDEITNIMVENSNLFE